MLVSIHWIDFISPDGLWPGAWQVTFFVVMNSYDSCLLKLTGGQQCVLSWTRKHDSGTWVRAAASLGIVIFFSSSTTDYFQILISFLFPYLAYLVPHFPHSDFLILFCLPLPTSFIGHLRGYPVLCPERLPCGPGCFLPLQAWPRLAYLTGLGFSAPPPPLLNELSSRVVQTFPPVPHPPHGTCCAALWLLSSCPLDQTRGALKAHTVFLTVESLSYGIRPGTLTTLDVNLLHQGVDECWITGGVKMKDLHGQLC